MIIKIIRFLITGCLSTVINYSIFYLFYNIFDIFYILSSSLGYISGLIFGYFLNKNWTYINQVVPGHKYVFSYFTSYFLSLIISQCFLYALVEFYYIDPKVANFGAIFISTCMNFLLTNFIVFRKNFFNRATTFL